MTSLLPHCSWEERARGKGRGGGIREEERGEEDGQIKELYQVVKTLGRYLHDASLHVSVKEKRNQIE